MPDTIATNTGAYLPNVRSSANDLFSGWYKIFFKPLVTNTQETKVSKKDIPTQYLLDSLKESEADVKAGRVITFATGQAALNYLDEEIGNDQRNK